MSQRLTLAEIRQMVLDELDDEWRTPTELGRWLGLDNGAGWYRLALTPRAARQRRPRRTEDTGLDRPPVPTGRGRGVFANEGAR